MAGMDKYYKILGISSDAPITEIKSAYRKLAKSNHPDTSTKDLKTAEKDFRRINEAYIKILESKNSEGTNDGIGKEYKETRNIKRKRYGSPPRQSIERFFEEILNHFFTREYHRSNYRAREEWIGSRESSSNFENGLGHKHDRFTVCFKCEPRR